MNVSFVAFGDRLAVEPGCTNENQTTGIVKVRYEYIANCCLATCSLSCSVHEQRPVKTNKDKKSKVEEIRVRFSNCWLHPCHHAHHKLKILQNVLFAVLRHSRMR